MEIQCPKCNRAITVDDLAKITAKCECGNVTYLPRRASVDDGSKVLWCGIPSRLAYWGYYLMGLFLIILGLFIATSRILEGVGFFSEWIILGLIILGIAVIAGVEVVRRFTLYQITQVVITYKTGILSHNIKEIPVNHVREVSLEQGLIARMLDTGKLGFSTSASDGLEIVYHGVKDPNKIRDMVRDMLD